MPRTGSQTTCPLCRQPNGCMATEAGPCWCEGLPVPAELLARVPAAEKGKSCICRSCIEAYLTTRTG